MKRALFVTTNPELGGAQKWTFDQIILLKEEYDIYLATGSKGWLSNIAKDRCKKILIEKGLYSFSSIRYLFIIWRFVKQNQIDIVIASSANAGIYARLLKVLIPSLAVVYVSHGWSSVYRGNRIYQWIEKGLSFLSSSILVVSQSDYDKAVNLLHISVRKLKLIENSIFPLCSERIDNPIAIDKGGRLNIVMVARFDRPKRQDLLIGAARKLSHMDFHFVGEGSRLHLFQKDAPSNVIFWGTLQQVSDVLRKADIVVLLSDSEGMPLSVLEGLSCAKPLLLSHIPSMNIFIEDNGVLVENNIDAVISGLREISNQNLEALGKASQELFDRKFNLEMKTEKYLSYYRSLIS